MNIIITSVIVPLLIAITGYAVNYLNNKIKNDKAEKYILIAEDAVCTAVTSVAQTYVDALKKDGKFDEEAQKVAFDEAKYKAVAIMGEAAREALKEVFGDIDSWLDNKIQYYVRKNKVLS